MPNRSNLKKKIFIYMAIAGLVPLLLLSFQNHYFGKKVIGKLEKEHLQFALKSRMLWLREWLRHSKKEFSRISNQINIENNSLSPDDLKTLQFATEALFKGHASYESLTIYDKNWTAIEHFPKNPHLEKSPSEIFKTKFVQDTLFVTDEHFVDQDGQTILPLGQSIIDQTGSITGYIIAELNITKSLRRIMSNKSDMDESGKLYLLSSTGNFLYHSPPHNHQPQPFTKKGLPQDLLNPPYWELKERIDCQGVRFFSLAADIPEMDWILIAEVNKMYVLNEFQNYIWFGSVTAIGLLFAILALAWRSSANLADPLSELSRVAKHISEGNHQERLPEFVDNNLNEMRNAFNTMLDTLEENKKSVIQTISLSAVGKLSSSIVHEMRNPLSSVKINLQALSRKVKNDPTYSEMADIALMQVKRLESMFTELLNFSKPIQLNIEEISFRQLADEVRDILCQKAADKIISLEVIDNMGDTLLHIDKKHMVLALINLVDNAIQWSPKNSTVEISTERSPDNNGFIISIKDSGPGLRQEQMAKLFQPFYTTRDKGTGLGLANVKKIVEFHGGTITANNRQEGGAQFSMIFKGRISE